MRATVRNIRDGSYDPSNSEHVYIGRQNSAWGLDKTKWANPFIMKTEPQRQYVLNKFRRRLEMRSDLLAALPELRGKTLYCWCAPRECHGDVLAELANAEAAPETEADSPRSGIAADGSAT